MKRLSRYNSTKNMQRVLVALDGTRTACRALCEAKKVIERIGGRLTVLSVVPSIDVPENSDGRTLRIERLMKGVREAFSLEGITVETIIYNSKDPVRAVTNLAKSLKMDFIVIGSHWEKAQKSSPWGRVAALIAQTAPCTVLVV